MKDTDVREILRRYRDMENTLDLLPHLSSDCHDRMEVMQRQKTVVLSWLGLLTAKERFILERHLIFGLSWREVSVEYEARWGVNGLRHERTLKRYQAGALEKICRNIRENGLEGELAELFFHCG